MEEEIKDLIAKRRKEMRRKMRRKIAEARQQIGDKFPEKDVVKAWTKQFMKVKELEKTNTEAFKFKKVTNGYERKQTDEPSD